MTSDGISTGDWDHVHQLAVDVVNANGDVVQSNRATQVMRSYLRELRDRYGDRPSLVATEADYADSPEESERLLLRAFDLALQLSDVTNLKAIALALADLYATQLHDMTSARSWLDVARQWIKVASGSDARDYRDLERAITSESDE
jgi:hypothetical protein